MQGAGRRAQSVGIGVWGLGFRVEVVGLRL